MSEERLSIQNPRNGSTNPINDLGLQMFMQGQLNCSHCHELLCVPIVLVDGGAGNMCEKCFEVVNEEGREIELKGIPNVLLNDFVKTLEFPCKFQSSGCQNVLTYDEKPAHEKECLYQPYNCLLLLNNALSLCDWSGSILNLIEHFTENHAMHVVEIQNNKFHFDLLLSECDIPFVKLLKNQNVCIFFIACIKLDKMLYTVFDGKDNATPVYEHVKISHNVGPATTINLQCKVGTLRDHIRSSVQECEMNLSLLTQFRENAVALQIKNVSNKICIMSKNISHHFECPVCNKIMFSAIQMCIAGHSFCGECKLKLTSCPTCRGPIQNTRNFALEHVSGDVLHPCHYECGESFLGSKLQDHMKNCEYKTFKCHLDIFVGDYNALKNHFKTMHVKDCIFSHFCELQIVLIDNVKFVQNRYIFFQNSLFVLLVRQQDQNFTWFVYNANSFQNKSNCEGNFIYEISLIHSKNESCKLTMSACCQNHNKADPNCFITLPYPTLLKYKDEQGKIKMTCTIKDIN